MANKVIFTDNDEEVKELTRDEIETWYMEFNPYDIWDSDRLEDDLKKTPLKDLADIYFEFEKNMSGSYEIIRDHLDKDIADSLINEINQIINNLCSMISPEELNTFLNELAEKTLAN